MGRKHNTVRDLLKSSLALISEEDTKFQLALDECPHDANWTILVQERARGSKLESAFRTQRRLIINKTTHALSLLPSSKAASRNLSQRDVAHVPVNQNARLPTQDVMTNQSEEAERREPMRVALQQYANRSTAKQVKKPRNNQKQRNLTQNDNQAIEYQLPDSLDADIDVNIKIAKPAPVKNESETVKWDTGRTYTEKAEIQQPNHPMVTNHCAPTQQFPPCQGVKPRISNHRRNAINRYGAF